MIHDSVAQAVGGTPAVRLARLFGGTGVEVIAKLEYLNPFGSTKDRVARHVLEQSLERGLLRRGGRVVESSSGNFGIALAALGQLYGLRTTCVVDRTICAANLVILRNLGADVQMVHEPAPDGGYLAARLRRVHDLLAEDPGALWVNQYANELCWQAHYATTAAEIVADVAGEVDVLAVAVSTTATLVGLSRRLRLQWPHLHVVAVDADGSAVFGGPNRPRRLPGLGSGRPSELLRPGDVDQVVTVSEPEATAGCRALLHREGILAGASSGAVVAALRRLVPDLHPGSTVVTVLPDRGERYLELVYEPVPDPVRWAGTS